MLTRFTDFLLPDHQRRSLADLEGDLDLGAGDAAAKRSAFWIMLTLSAIIASAGVLADSTATVIGAMIIAPLSTPILGIGLGIADRDPVLGRRALGYLVAGALLALAIGACFSVLVPGSADLLGDSQIAGRTSPGLTDLAAALATGVAGSIAMCRRDVASVLPGVAIAISLVPPLTVAGVCLGKGALALAFGALLLFLSNVLALVLIGALVFTVVVRSTREEAAGSRSRRPTYLGLGLGMLIIGVPLLANTATTILVSVWKARVTQAAQAWADQSPGTVVRTIDVRANEIEIEVLSPGTPPDVAGLSAQLSGQIPDGIPIVIDVVAGQRLSTRVGD